MTKEENNQTAASRYRHPYEGYPSSFCHDIPLVAEDYGKDGLDSDELEILHKLRSALRKTEYCISCELGEYVLLDMNDSPLIYGGPRKIVAFCSRNDILTHEDVQAILCLTKK